MRMPETLDDVTAARVSKLCASLEHATRHKVLAILFVDEEREPYVITKPGCERIVVDILSQIHWPTMIRVAEEWTP